MKKQQNYTWNLAHFFTSDDDPQIEQQRNVVQEQSYAFIEKWRERSDYLEDPAVLKEALDEYENWLNLYGTDGNEGFYFWLRSELEQDNPEVKARINKVVDFSQKIGNDIEFFTHRLAKIPETDQDKFLNYAPLKPYHHFLKKLFEEAKYLLSEPEEKIMNLKSKPAHGNWVRMTSEFLSKETRRIKIKKTADGEYLQEVQSFNEVLGKLDDPDKVIRDDAARAFNEILERWEDVAEVELNSVLEDKKINDELRKIDRPDRLRHIGDDIATEVVDTLVETTTKNFDLAQRFYALKAKLLGVPKLEYHERNVVYGDLNKDYSFDQARELIAKVFEQLDPQFVQIFESFFAEGRIDVFPKKGKASGAFLASGLKSQPLYILLNHTGKLHDVLTLAHEMGHAIHYEFSRKQNAIDFGATTSTAEVASTFMEDFVLQEIMHDADDELRLALYMMKLNDDISTIYRQVALYNFETDLHREFRSLGYLAKKQIGELFQKNMQAYMGPSVDQSPGSQNWWIYISHIRMFFYVYSYASGLLISKALQRNVKEEHSFIEKVKGFFTAGDSATPHTIFSALGIDISDSTFWLQGLEEVDVLMHETEALAGKLGKL